MKDKKKKKEKKENKKNDDIGESKYIPSIPPEPKKQKVKNENDRL